MASYKVCAILCDLVEHLIVLIRKCVTTPPMLTVDNWRPMFWPIADLRCARLVAIILSSLWDRNQARESREMIQYRPAAVMWRRRYQKIKFISLLPHRCSLSESLGTNLTVGFFSLGSQTRQGSFYWQYQGSYLDLAVWYRDNPLRNSIKISTHTESAMLPSTNRMDGETRRVREYFWNDNQDEAMWELGVSFRYDPNVHF